MAARGAKRTWGIALPGSKEILSVTKDAARVWQPRMGALRGNRNAAKPLSAMKARVRDLKRRIRAALKAMP
jgi:hypothetical protein